MRELYALDEERLLLTASDRISVFDVVLPTPIPDKGCVLTGLSAFWFARTQDVVPNHLLAVRDDGRSLECRRLQMLPVEFVVRGYLAGSGWNDYRETGAICGHPLPVGLRESDRLPEPIVTPATKAESGHDLNIDESEAAKLCGTEAYEAARAATLALYRVAAEHAERCGIIVADTKFEFGLGQAWGQEDQRPGPPEERIERGRRPAGRRPADRNWHQLEDQLILIDEALTPDSSRFWDAASYEPGRPQASFDKQFVRDYLRTLAWDKTAPGPALPDDVIAGTRARYVEAFERITGASFARYLQEDVIAR